MDLLLKEMYNQCDMFNDESMLPSVITCNSITNAHTQSIINSDDSNDNSNVKTIIRLEDVLKEMKEPCNKDYYFIRLLNFKSV